MAAVGEFGVVGRGGGVKANDQRGSRVGAPRLPEENGEEAPGVPGLRTWRAIYVFVFVVFVACVGLLAWLGGAGK